MRGWLAGHSTSLIVCLHPESGTVAAPVPLVISVALRAGVASLHAVVAPRPLTRHPRHTLGIAGAVRCGGAARRCRRVTVVLLAAARGARVQVDARGPGGAAVGALGRRPALAPARRARRHRVHRRGRRAGRAAHRDHHILSHTPRARAHCT